MVRVGKVQRWEEAQEAAVEKERRRLHVKDSRKGAAGREGMLFTSLVMDVDNNDKNDYLMHLPSTCPTYERCSRRFQRYSQGK